MDNECGHGDDKELEVKPIHFFKIILTHSLQEGKLMIPKKFVEKYGEGLPKTAFLKAPNGVEWKVNLVKHDGKIWFEKGWKEFAEYHSLAEGHIVVLRYERMSNFQVFIFDMSALEIDYPFKRVQGKRTSNDHGNKPVMVENLEDYEPSQKRKDNPSLECFEEVKKKSRCVEIESISNLRKATLHHTGKKCKEGPHTTAKKISALDSARSFKSRNPFCVVVMYRSYLEFKANLNLPSKFGNRYFDLGTKRGDINLQLENGRVWPARYLIRESYMGTKFEISNGWKPFVMDNNLKVGDVCFFELIDRTKLTFQVYISRKRDNSKCSTSQGFKSIVRGPKHEYEMSGSGIPSLNFREKPTTAAKQSAVLDRATSFKVCNPSFRVEMHLSYVCSGAQLNLPSRFCKMYFDLDKKRGDINLRILNGRVWHASFLIKKSDTRTKFHLSAGWEAFAKENDLKVGDDCTFELIERTNLTFQVYISRKSEYSICPTPQGRFDYLLMCLEIMDPQFRCIVERRRGISADWEIMSLEMEWSSRLCQTLIEWTLCSRRLEKRVLESWKGT